MKDLRTPSNLNTQIYREACKWFVECRSGDLDDAMRREFDQWLRKSPEHLSAYVEIAAIWNDGSALDPERRWSAELLVAQARAENENIVPLRRGAASGAEGESSSRTTWRARSIAASIGAACLVAAGTLFIALRPPTYATGIGEQRSIVLADGSTVELNSRSHIEVRYSDDTRSIELLEGQALFKVAKNPARPFVVTSGGAVVRAVGTQFDVYKKHDGTVVTVVEGRVAIAGSGLASGRGAGSDQSMPASISQGNEREYQVSAGRQVTVRPASVEEAAHPNIASAIAWRQRQLVFESASLSQVAEEFNRYNERQLVIQDAELHEFHISGVFSSSDPASLVRFLRERPEVHVTETEVEIRVTKTSR